MDTTLGDQSKQQYKHVLVVYKVCFFDLSLVCSTMTNTAGRMLILQDCPQKNSGLSTAFALHLFGTTSHMISKMRLGSIC